MYQLATFAVGVWTIVLMVGLGRIWHWTHDCHRSLRRLVELAEKDRR